MRNKLFVIWAAVRWLPLMFLIAPAMEAPLVAHLSDPPKPIKTWVGNASWYGPGFNGRKVRETGCRPCRHVQDRQPVVYGRRPRGGPRNRGAGARRLPGPEIPRHP